MTIIAEIVKAANEIIADKIADGAEHLNGETRESYMAAMCTARAWIADGQSVALSLPSERWAYVAGEILDIATATTDERHLVNAHIWPKDDGAVLTLGCECRTH